MADFLPSRTALVCIPNCLLSNNEIEQQRKSKEIDRCISREKTYVKRLVKILLLGAGESGKSTFLKQMRIIHGQDFDQRAREEFRATIYTNVIKGTAVLLGHGEPSRSYAPNLLLFQSETDLAWRTFSEKFRVHAHKSQCEVELASVACSGSESFAPRLVLPHKSDKLPL